MGNNTLGQEFISNLYHVVLNIPSVTLKTQYFVCTSFAIFFWNWILEKKRRHIVDLVLTWSMSILYSIELDIADHVEYYYLFNKPLSRALSTMVWKLHHLKLVYIHYFVQCFKYFGLYHNFWSKSSYLKFVN